ncbi:MAG: type IV pilin protein [Burkholderiales bacterium]
MRFGRAMGGHRGMLNAHPPRRPHGLTLIELMIVLIVAGVLATLALPSFQAQIRKTRRADAYAAVTQIQQAQERWRSLQPTYAASLSALGIGASSTAGHYQLATATESGTENSRYTITAAAAGSQSSDAACRYLRTVAAGGTLSQQSGPDNSFGNSAADNRACWNQ